jgi:hypothetical protein
MESFAWPWPKWHFTLVRQLISLCFLAAPFTPRAAAEDFDPFQTDAWPGVPMSLAGDPFESLPYAGPVQQAANIVPGTSLPYPVTNTVYQPQPLPQPMQTLPPLTQPPAPQTPGSAAVSNVPPPGCGVPQEKLLQQLTIQIGLPQGELPADRAAACWQQLNASSGPLAAARFWSRQAYLWDATCMAHRPLYFEEINLERYGYGCHDCLQPFASAAHFFATVPALPYCLGADCPGECHYTLGHYRPGSCPPWRCHRPPTSGLGALSAGGVWTGLIFLIP